jgi:GLPGLI family protein
VAQLKNNDMKFNQFITGCLLLIITQSAFAQNKRFTTSGTIEFERKVNMYALIKNMVKANPNNTFYVKMSEEYQKTQPQFKTMKSTLTFAKDQTLFKPIEENLPPNSFFGDDPNSSQLNTILTNTTLGTSITQKKVFEEVYLVKDSTRKINWKITNEIRNIAGYDCRRANALIMDSVYVVAFYTEEISVSGGPETFSGLPGMILGVALPYEHITWFATAVTDQPITDDKIKAPVKGKPTDNKQLKETLKNALKEWGSYALGMMKAFLM